MEVLVTVRPEGLRSLAQLAAVLALLLVSPLALAADEKPPVTADAAQLATLRAERQALVDADAQFAWLESCEKAGSGCPLGLERPTLRRICGAVCLLRVERERSHLRRAEIDREIAEFEARLARLPAP